VGTTRAQRTWAIRGFALVVVVAATIYTVTRGGSHASAPAPKPRAAAKACTLPAHWYPPGTSLATPQQRDVLLKHFGLSAEPGQVAVEKDAHGTVTATLFAVTASTDGLMRALDATRPKGAKIDQPLTGVTRVASPNGAFEYGRKGCAVYLAIGNGRETDALMSTIWG
jgi:hypothetical protein